MLAGSVGESILFPDLEPLPAEHNRAEALALASACATPPLAMVAFREAEARAILTTNRDVHEALTAAHVESNELSGDEDDQIIRHAVAEKAFAVEKQRRTDWQKVIVSRNVPKPICRWAHPSYRGLAWCEQKSASTDRGVWNDR